MSGDDIEDRVEEFEERLTAVEETLQRYREQHALVLAQVDIDALDTPTCPECGDGELTKDSGLSWAKAVCSDCGSEWVLSG